MSTDTNTTTLDPDYLTLAEAAALLRVTTKAVRGWIAAGRLPAYRLGTRAVRIRRVDALAMLTPLGVAK